MLKFVKNYIRKQRLMKLIWEEINYRMSIDQYQYAAILSQRYDKVRNL